MIYREILEFDIEKDDFIDITEHINNIVAKCGIPEGLCNIFLPASTAGLILNENDNFLISDFKRFFSIIDENKPYAHPDNAHSHLRAAMLALPEKTIPISKGRLVLGTWQNIMLWNFDTRPRKRKVIITIMD